MFYRSTRNFMRLKRIFFMLEKCKEDAPKLTGVSVLLIIVISVTTFDHLFVDGNAETVSQNCLGCINNTNTQVLTIFNFQTENNPFLAGDAAFIVMPNPYSHTTNSTHYLDLNTWYNFVVADNDQFDSDPTPGIIELIGVNNGTYSVWQIKGSPGFGMAPHPEASDDILGTTGFSYITQTFVNFTSTGTTTIEPPTLNSTMLGKLSNGGAKVNGVTVSSSNDLPPAKQIASNQKTTATPPKPVIFSTSMSGNTSPSSLLSSFGIPTYSAPKGLGLSENTAFMPPVFVAPVSGGGKFIMPPIIDEVSPGTNIVIRMDEVEQGTAHHFIKAIDLPMNTYGTNVGISIKVDTANPTGVAIPSGNVALFLEFEETGDIDFSDSSTFSEDPTIHFNVEKDGTSCPTGIVLYLLESGHWHEVTPTPTRNPSGDTDHTCAYTSTVEHFSSYLVGSGSEGHSHRDSGDHGSHSSDHSSHTSGHEGHGGHGGHGNEEHEGHGGAYATITKDLNIFKIEYDLHKAIARITVGTTGSISDLEVQIYAKVGKIRMAHPTSDKPQIIEVMGNSMKKYVFTVPLDPREEYFRVFVEDRNYNLAHTVDIRGPTGTIVPWFAGIHDGMSHDEHSMHHDTADDSEHASHIRNTGYEIKFEGGKKIVEYNGMQFPIKYEMAGSISGIKVDEESRSVTFLLNYVTGGELILQVPRELVDAIDDNFVVFVTASPEKQVEYVVIASTFDYYTLRMDLPENAQTMTIIGSTVVPEFGALATLVLVASLAAAAIAFRIKSPQITASRFS